MTHHRPLPDAAHPALTPDTQARNQVAGNQAPTNGPGQHRGMPAYAPQTDSRTTGEPQTPSDASVKESTELPHQRDQHVAMTDDKVNPHIQQASDDLASGRQDTSRSVEVDRTYHEVQRGKP